MENLVVFLDALKRGETDVFKLLDTPENIFETMPFETLFGNEDDVLHGMNRMQRYFDGFYFDLFDKLLIKHFDNGEIKFGLYVQTTDADDVAAFSKFLLDHFHDEIAKYKQQPSFRDHARINDFANGKAPTDSNEIVDLWEAHDVSFALFYVNAPVNVFGWTISVTPEKVIERHVRRNGTILDLLDFDINLILAIGDSCEPEEVDPDNGNFVDYTYLLNKKQLGLFDIIKIRIFDRQRMFREDVRTNIFLSSSKRVEFDDISSLVEKLRGLYGDDNRGIAEVEYSEREAFELLGMFLGRRWTFNHTHGLWDQNIEDEDIAYEVSLNNIDKQGEFKLTILGFNDLVSLFG